jgi:hypothetical protein
MSRFATVLLFGLSIVFALGCDREPVVVTPDADDETTIIEERDVDVEPTTPAPQSGSSVDVEVGGGKGVDVNVNPDAGDSAAPTDDPAPSQ